jgi:hypothetical protein
MYRGRSTCTLAAMHSIRVAVLLFGSASTALAASSGETPPNPYEDWGACPFECCTYREWRASSAATAYTDRAESSPIAFSIAKGEKVRAITGVVVTTRYGMVKLRTAMKIGIPKTAKSPDPILSLQAGEAIYTLHYEGEGSYLFWYKGSVSSDEVADSADDEHFEVVSKPETVWWAKVQSVNGQVGWVKMLGTFKNVDACG